MSPGKIAASDSEMTMRASEGQLIEVPRSTWIKLEGPDIPKAWLQILHTEPTLVG